MSKKIGKGDTVTLDCLGMLGNGIVFLDSKEDGPIKFQVGSTEIIKGLSSTVLGMVLNEEKKVTLEPEDAYGARDESLMMEIAIDQLPEDVQEGAQLKSADDEGKEIIWSVVEVAKDSVTLDGNHVLAGHQLTFEIKIIAID